MIPILYDRFETSFTSQGLGVLADCTRCVVTEEVNGIYECEFDYPMTGPMYQQLINFGGIVSVEHDHNGDRQPFDIYKYSAPIEGVVTFYASHVSYRLSNYIESTANSYSSPREMLTRFDLDGFLIAGQTAKFYFYDYSDYGIDTGEEFIGQEWYDRRGLLLGTDDHFSNGSFLYVFPGEFVFDCFKVEFYNKRGTDNGVQIRYGKNMGTVERERDQGSIVSGVLPTWFDSNGDQVLIVESPVFSSKVNTNIAPWTDHSGDFMSTTDGEQMFFNAADIRVSVVDFTEMFENEPTKAQLEKAARDYMSKNSTWRANDNITVSFIDLYGSPEYEDIKGLEKCSLGDFVSIYYPELGIVSENVEIMSATYDVLAERFTEMQLGTIRTTLAQTIIDYIGGMGK